MFWQQAVAASSALTELDWVGLGDLFKNNMFISVNYCLFPYYRLYYANGWRIGG